MSRALSVISLIAILWSGFTRSVIQSARSAAAPKSAAAPVAIAEPHAVSDCPVTQPIRDQPPRDPSADPFPFGPWYVNADRTIWAGWDAASCVSGEKGNKVLWIRPQGTQLKVSGRRLDADAPPLKAVIPCCYPSGFQATGLFFPTAGCWEVTATAGSSELKYVTIVCQSPEITRQPVDQTIRAGETATLTVEYSATPPVSLQWYEGATGDSSKPVSGATNASFTTPVLNNTTSYWVRIANECSAAQSASAKIAVVSPSRRRP